MEKTPKRVRHVDFADRISPFRGDYTTLNVTKPQIRVELNKVVYRITATFTLEVDLIDFDAESQEFNKFFDSVSLRYLFKTPERHEYLPEADSWAKAKLTNESAHERGGNVGASGEASAIAPNIDFHFQSNNTVTVEREGMESWRRGVSQEHYLADKDYSTQSYCARIAHKIAPQPRHLHFFQVHPPNHHKEHHYGRHCRWVRWPNMYDSAVHWFWQTQWDTHMWVPEVYQSFKMPVTIKREIPRKYLKSILVDNPHTFEGKLRYLHFDFEVEARVRELGQRSNIFSRAGKPPDTRAKHDSGEPRGSDLSAFCLYCSFSDFDSWPTEPTLDLEDLARAWVKQEMESTGHIPRKLQSGKKMYKDVVGSRDRITRERSRSCGRDTSARENLWREEDEWDTMLRPSRHYARPIQREHVYCERRRSGAALSEEKEWEMRQQKLEHEKLERERAEQDHKRKLEQESLEAFVSSRAERHSREGTRPSHDEVVLEDALCNAEYRRWWSERRLREEILDLKEQLQEADRARREAETERLNKELEEAETRLKMEEFMRGRSSIRRSRQMAPSPIRSVSSSPHSPTTTPDRSPERVRNAESETRIATERERVTRTRIFLPPRRTLSLSADHARGSRIHSPHEPSREGLRKRVVRTR